MPKIHELKTWPEYYKEVETGNKTFEIRKNDRDYNVGDYLMLMEYDPLKQQFTGEEIVKKVTYILNKEPFVPKEYVCMAIQDLS